MKAIKGTLGIITLTLALGVSTQAQTFLTNGLVAYYPFNGNANDAAGTNNGTVYGATLTPDRFGNPNRAYSFNGTSARIVTAAPLPAMQSASASCWINVPAFPVVWDYIFNEGSLIPQHVFDLTLNYGQISMNTVDTANLMANLPLLTNTWFQVVCVANNDNTNRLSIWVNGQLVGTAASLGSANGGDTFPLYIGCRAVYDDYSFHGALDDLRFYNRALSDAEVQQLYAYELTNSTPPPPPPFQITNGLVAYYPLNGNAADASGNGNNGTPLERHFHHRQVRSAGPSGAVLGRGGRKFSH